MRTFVLTVLFFLAHAIQSFAFCGFYVAKADAKLFNKTSQVIIARDGTQVAITMSSDFEGEVKDFAMVVPVAEVIQRHQIRIAKQNIFDILDAYSGPRLVEYYDENPCQMRYNDYALSETMVAAAPMDKMMMEKEESLEDGVQILESYTIGEYDILILSAEESNGLERWLTRNGYKIPAKAASILEPYVKSDMKFFVVKVNLENFKKQKLEKLRPIQMTFRSERFMLPIRLGMANAKGDQDMIVYAFSKKGRIESTNYRTLEIPSNMDIPLSIQPKFGQFYTSVFDKAWKDAGKNALMLEYAWDLSSRNYVKCDPCVGTPPQYTDLREAGVFWVTDQRYGSSNYTGDIYMTRLHVRYNRKTFPQDLMFQETPNQQNFQGRYVMRHPATGNLSCDAGQKYVQNLHTRRVEEVKNLASLTDWSTGEYQEYIREYDKFLKNGNSPFLQPLPKKNDKGKGVLPIALPQNQVPQLPAWFLIGMSVLVIFSVALLIRKNQRKLQLSLWCVVGKA
ncbi:MAG: DUF2330 domain-containing protein, partial [Bacteroidota bacterium]